MHLKFTIRIYNSCSKPVTITNISGESAAFRLHGQMTIHQTTHVINLKTTIYNFVRPSHPTCPRQTLKVQQASSSKSLVKTIWYVIAFSVLTTCHRVMHGPHVGSEVGTLAIGAFQGYSSYHR